MSCLLNQNQMTTKDNSKKPARKRSRKRSPNKGKRKPGSKPPKVSVDITGGGVVFKRTKKGLRIAFMLDAYGKWTFAKGHQEKGETVGETALRETTEEMGLRDLKLGQPLGVIDFWYREKYRPQTKGMLTHKFVHYFLMEAPPGEWGKPEKEEKIKKIIWVPARRALRQSDYDDVRPVLEKALIALGVRKRLPPAPKRPKKPRKKRGKPPAKDKKT